ncbi:serine hydrolase domain-containing protein [Pseudonocardia sp. NPDC049635]|uniref:serine hydrolase domain-containing protein n=1 Tax=Pseudonocardia sp. NPDC049635 TaxID=3155506 RepID=UPI0033F5C963
MVQHATPARGTRTARSRGVAGVLVVTAVLAGLLLGGLVGPHGPRAAPPAGDPGPAADLAAAFGDPRGFGAVTAARVQDGVTTVATLGSAGVTPGPRARYEPGSIVKTFTAMLVADGVERGELRLTDRVEVWLPELTGTPAGSVTLQELATHTSGLPPATAAASLVPVLTNENPYDISTAALLDDARNAPLGERGGFAYSNLGFALLGHAHARAAGAADWPALLHERLLDPLGMTETSIRTDGPDPEVAPLLSNGWRAPSWWGEGFAPSGAAATTTATDLARFADAVLAGRAPGAAALEPLAPAGGTDRIGLAWYVSEIDGRTVTWHNGGTGGHRSLIALDRERGEAVVVLNNTDRWADEQGLALLTGGSSEEGPDTGVALWVVTAVGVAALAGSVVSLLRVRSRTHLGGGILLGLFALVLLLTSGPWVVVPGPLWTASAAGWLAVVGLAVRRWRALPGRTPGRRTATELTTTLLAAVLLALTVWAS